MSTGPAEASSKSVAVIGAGAAGYFTAICVAELCPDAKVTLFEATRKVLSKVAISGGGRCNVTHHCFEPKDLVRFYPRGGRELRGAFHQWQPRDTVEWFQHRGVELKTEADGRMFPVTDSSQTIIDCLQTSATRAGVDLRIQTGVSSVSIHETSGFTLKTKTGETHRASQVMIATGGGMTNAGHGLARELGHRITELAPSLFTFHIEHPLLDGLQGLSLPDVQTRFAPAKLEQRGPVVFTHWGLSGPGILKLSAWGARDFKAVDYHCELQVNWIAGTKPEAARQTLIGAKAEYARKSLSSANPFDLPKRFWERLLACSEAAADGQWAQLSNKAINRLVELLCNTRLTSTGKSMNKDEFVTCGGVDLKEIDFKTMQSKRVPGLYFAGEVLDIDGVTGGFNFQAAWTTARIAAQAIAAQ